MDAKDVPVTNEVLAEKIDGLSSRVSDLQALTQTFGTTFVSREVFDLRFRALDVSIKNIDVTQTASNLEIDKLKNKRIVPTIITSTIAAVLSSAFTYLLYARLQ